MGSVTTALDNLGLRELAGRAEAERVHEGWAASDERGAARSGAEGGERGHWIVPAIGRLRKSGDA